MTADRGGADVSHASAAATLEAAVLPTESCSLVVAGCTRSVGSWLGPATTATVIDS